MSHSTPGSVSIIVPARNEEANIARLLRSLAAQQGAREILVVDDQSEDGTAAVLKSLEAEIPLLRVLRVDVLPEGWLGKTYAANLAAGEATGEWLLFTDADTVHQPGSLEAVLELAEKEGADLLSLSPGQQTPTWWEKAVIPQVYVNLARLYRFEEVSDPASPSAAANGQYLLVRREVYARVGGHEAIRGEVLDDVELAKRVKSAGGKLVFLPGSAWVETRMYRTFREMWSGWTKNLFLLHGRSRANILKTIAELWVLDLLPQIFLIVLVLGLFSGHGNAGEFYAALGCLLVVVARHVGYWRAVTRLGFDPGVVPWRMEGAALLSALLVSSFVAHRVSRQVDWKGRSYSTRG
jgi:glycosyltransferase involved in cell wall biosynthesis